MWEEITDSRFVAFDGDWEAFEKKSNDSIENYYEFLIRMKKVNQAREEERKKRNENRR